MKKYNEFIKEDIIDFGKSDVLLSDQEQQYFKVLKLFMNMLKKNWENMFEKNEDRFGEYVRNIYTMQDIDLKKLIKKGNSALPMIMKITTFPPADLDEFLDFFEKLKSSLDVKNYMDVEPISSGEIKVDVNIPLKWIDENTLKSFNGIDKFNL